MKNPFKRPKGQSLDDRRQVRTDLAYKLQAAQDDLSGARHNAVMAALAVVNDSEQSRAEGEIHRAEIHAATLENALLAMDVEIADAEEAERVAADQAQRQATADDLERRAVQLDKAAAPIGKMLADLKEALDGCVPVVGEIGMPGFVAELVKALPDGCITIAAEVRGRGAATLAGRAPASLAKPFIPQIVEKPIGPTKQIFALEHLRWKPTGPGEASQADAFHLVALPVKYAQIALDLRVAVLPDDPRVQAIRSNRHGPSAGVPKIVDLDRDPRTVSVFDHATGRHIRDELPAALEPFQNYRAGEAPKQVWMDRGPEPEPDQSGPNEGIFE